MHSQIEIEYFDGKMDKHEVNADSDCVIEQDMGEGRVVSIKTVQGIHMRLNWSGIKKIGFHPAPTAKKNTEDELKFEPV